MLLEAFAVVVLCVVSGLIFRKWKTTASAGHLPPPPFLPSLPLIGSMPFIRMVNIFEFLMEKSTHLGPIFTFRAGSKLVLTLNSREAIEETLMKNPNAFASRPKLCMVHNITPDYNGITFAATTVERKRVREATASVMKGFGFGVKKEMEEIILKEVELMKQFAHLNTGTLLESNRLSIQMTSNVIMMMMFSSRRDYDEEVSELLQELVQFGVSLDISWDIAPALQFLPRYREKASVMLNCTEKIHSCLEALVSASLLENSDKESFILRYIEKEGPCYERRQLIYVLRDIIFGGAVATAVALQWSLVALVNHPEIQKKLQKEIDSNVPRDRLPTMEDRAKLNYVEATLLELFRWRTLLPLSLPRVTMIDSTIMDYHIPAGTMVLPNQYAVHNDPKVWSDPNEFRPERFLDVDGNIINKHQIIPFGLGQRSCFGQLLVREELFLFIASLMQHFTVAPPEAGQKVNDTPLQPVGVVTIPLPFAFRLVERK